MLSHFRNAQSREIFIVDVLISFCLVKVSDINEVHREYERYLFLDSSTRALWQFPVLADHFSGLVDKMTISSDGSNVRSNMCKMKKCGFYFST